MWAYGPVTLRPIEQRDMKMLRDLLNDPDIVSSVVDYGFPVSAAAQEEWFAKVSPGENAYRFMVEADGETVGSILFSKVDQENKTGTLGYKIVREFQGHNYAYYAVCAITDFLFDKKGIECIIVNHLHTNAGSRRIMEKAGFLFEGTARSAVYKNGQRNDLVCWSCSREHYKKIRKDVV